MWASCTFSRSLVSAWSIQAFKGLSLGAERTDMHGVYKMQTDWQVQDEAQLPPFPRGIIDALLVLLKIPSNALRYHVVGQDAPCSHCHTLPCHDR